MEKNIYDSLHSDKVPIEYNSIAKYLIEHPEVIENKKWVTNNNIIIIKC